MSEEKTIKERAEAVSPVYGVDPTWKVGVYKLFHLVFVDMLSKSFVAVCMFPALCGAIVAGLHVNDVKVEIPIWLMISIEALLLGMWALKSTTKQVIADMGEAMKMWAARK